MTLEFFQSLVAAGYHKILMTHEIPADLETPLTAYLKLTGADPNSYLLESVVGGERFGRYSIVGLPTPKKWVVYGDRIERWQGTVCLNVQNGDPLTHIEQHLQQQKRYCPAGLSRFVGGLAGYFGYDCVRYIEPKLKNSAPDDHLKLPDIVLLETEQLAVFDNLRNSLILMVYADGLAADGWHVAKQQLLELARKLSTPIPMHQLVTQAPIRPINEHRHFQKDDYLQAVRKAKTYIEAGDLMQVQIGQRISTPFDAPPLSLYRALRSINPSPYMYYYQFGDFQVVGASPEILVQKKTMYDQSLVVIRPIAGTRPRGKTEHDDERLASELLSDPKEIAEHVMLIDLARNDIGRVAEIGSVKVRERLVIEKYSHVQHIVSDVAGVLRQNLSNMDILRATFPAGTLTGAPKVRAMELIDELEITKRGIYGGAVGYLSYNGEMDLAIAIRTGIIQNQQLHVQAAAGVVFDSIPESEYQETENKAKAVLQAARVAVEQQKKHQSNGQADESMGASGEQLC